MTNRNDITRQIQELLGSEDSFEVAQDMLEWLEAHQAVTFDAARGYEMIDEPEFSRIFDSGLAIVAMSKEVR